MFSDESDEFRPVSARPPRPASTWEVFGFAGSVAAAVAMCGLQGLIEAGRAYGGYKDQGGMLITLCVCPTHLLLWIAAGPVAVVGGGLAWRRAADNGDRPARPVQAWLYLGCVMTLLVVLALAVLLAIQQRA